VALVPVDGDLPPRASSGRRAGMPGLGFSLLRASAGVRLGLVAATVGVLWLAVFWALT
jgi:uncharacterized oligopeptide transporter (OPT) family protein